MKPAARIRKRRWVTNEHQGVRCDGLRLQRPRRYQGNPRVSERGRESASAEGRARARKGEREGFLAEGTLDNTIRPDRTGQALLYCPGP